jgi:hypothetical protein
MTHIERCIIAGIIVMVMAAFVLGWLAHAIWVATAW